MKLALKSIVVATLLATAGLAAFSQSPGGMMGHEGYGSMGHRDPAKMEQAMNKHMAELKAKLKLTPEQEGSWTTFTAAMKPSGAMPDMRQAHADMEKLTTPERIDKMRAMRAQLMSNMEKREDATKVFYASLNDEQKKTFDTVHARMGSRHHEGHHPAKGPQDAGAATPGAPAANKP